jgi:hypothetical protein
LKQLQQSEQVAAGSTESAFSLLSLSEEASAIRVYQFTDLSISLRSYLRICTVLALMFINSSWKSVVVNLMTLSVSISLSISLYFMEIRCIKSSG